MEQWKKKKTTQEDSLRDTAGDHSYVFLYWDDPGDSQEHVDNQDISHRGYHQPLINKNGNSDI